MESFESFTKHSKEQYEQQYAIERQLHDAVEDIDQIFQPRAFLRPADERTVADLPETQARLKQLSAAYIEALQYRAAEDTKLEFELDALRNKTEDFLSSISALAKKQELSEEDALSWDKEKKEYIKLLDHIHMTIVGTVSTRQNLNNPPSLN